MAVFTIPPSLPFIPTLTGALVGGRLVPGFPRRPWTRDGGNGIADPLELARATLYLPTRRACRLARDGFLDVTGAPAAILPRIVAIGDIDEDEIAFAQVATGGLAAEELELAPALAPLERRLLLVQLVLRWARAIAACEQDAAPLIASNPAAALGLADDLARLIDDMTTRQVAWKELDHLVPDALDRYWQLTLEFLKIAREAWPAILAERGVVESAARRDAVIRAEAARLLVRADDPVIVAGSTGSLPVTAELIAAVAKHPHGAVVLPGLDTDLEAPCWDMIESGPGHPQFAMQALLERVGVRRADVVPLASPASHGREFWLSEALRPPAATERWRELNQPGTALRLDRALDGLAVVEAGNPAEEALAIAVALREALEAPDRSAALVTPDRALARRVVAALERWQVEVDHSGGDALPDTAAGRFARLAAEAALDGLAPVPLLALLKHPLARLGARIGAHTQAVSALERAVLRGPRPRSGSSGLVHALASLRAQLTARASGQPSALHPADPRAALREWQLAAAAALVETLAAAVAPLETLADTPRPLAELVTRHGAVVAALSRDENGAPAAFAGPDGEALAATFDEISQSPAARGLMLPCSDYPELFRIAIADRVVRRPEKPDVRVRIFGVLEARLQQLDRVVLGSLVEGVWPPETRSDPWLSRPMRDALSLDLPERRISLSAHDFAQALGAKEVVLTYPAKLAGAPTVPSRFVQRLAAVAGDARWERALAAGAKYLDWARALDHPRRVKRIEKPAPRPPRLARPQRLSVTEIESWLRDPYTIYAKHVLDLRELDAVDLPPGASDRGIVIHEALGEFTARYSDRLPPDPAGALIEIASRHFAALEDYPEARAFWWPRFQRIARWLAGWEIGRRGAVAALAAETMGEIKINVGEREFSLRARADRIERLSSGEYAILDYKTGSVPSEKQVRIGLSPQLTLEAAILRHGGFPGIAHGSHIAELVYIALKGGDPAGEARPIEFKEGDADGHAERALAKLTEIVRRFEDDRQPYLPLVLPIWKNRYGTYDHLARVKEWSTGGDDEESESAGEAS